MSGRGAAGVLIVVIGVWWLVLNWRLQSDPSKLHPEHWRYRTVYNRLRRWPWQPRDPELSREEIKRYARGSMLASAVVIAVGLLLLATYLIE